MLKFISFSSGSCGNSYYLGTENKGIIIDAGVSLRRVKKTLQDNGLSLDNVNSILITHNHLDHIRHLGSFCKREPKNVYTTEFIHSVLARHTMTAEYLPPYVRYIQEDSPINIDDFEVTCFQVPHDAAQTVAYSIKIEEKCFVIITDIGRVTPSVIKYALEADALVLESNYDVDMLMRGPYTHELKMRIIQGEGHISNDECAEALTKIWTPKLKHIFLCHLSENNNTPKLAYESAYKCLIELGAEKGRFMLTALPRHYPSPIFNL